jgi:hypothetical protein
MKHEVQSVLPSRHLVGDQLEHWCRKCTKQVPRSLHMKGKCAQSIIDRGSYWCCISRGYNDMQHGNLAENEVFSYDSVTRY